MRVWAAPLISGTTCASPVAVIGLAAATSTLVFIAQAVEVSEGSPCEATLVVDSVLRGELQARCFVGKGIRFRKNERYLVFGGHRMT
jgi:hypothetical protein